MTKTSQSSSMLRSSSSKETKKKRNGDEGEEVEKKTKCFEDVSHWVNIVSTTGQIGVECLKLDQTAESVKPTGCPAVDAWRSCVLEAFAGLRASRGDQLRPLSLCEPLCGLLPGVAACQEGVLYTRLHAFVTEMH